MSRLNLRVALVGMAGVLLAPRAVAAAAPAATAVTPAPVVESPAGPNADADSESPPPAVYGLFPLWEHTGAVEAHGAARIGMRHAQVGLGPLTVGTDPYLDLYGTLNAGAKLGLIRRGPWRLALQLGWYRVPTGAESRGIGNLHASPFSNPYAPMTLLPAAAAATFLASRRVHLHASATVLRSLSEAPEMRATTGGVSAWVEWWATPTRSARLHAGVEGWPAATAQHVGISFAWRARYLAVQAGYARRFAPEGTSANAVMFDGALLFP
jgi:hypothetical protein